MHSSASGATALMVLRSVSRAARLSSLSAARYSSMVSGLAVFDWCRNAALAGLFWFHLIALSLVVYSSDICGEHLTSHKPSHARGRFRCYLILSDTLYQFHSQVLPLSGEKAWPHTGRSLSLASQRNMTIIFFSLKVSLAKKCPTPFSNEPTTGASKTPTLLATQYRLHNLVFGLKSLSVRPSKSFPSWPGISVVE